MTEHRKLVEQYRAAWEEFHRSLDRLQNAVDRGQSSELESPFLAVENARRKYNTARDRLAAEMLQADLAHIAPRSDEARIREIAHCFWELEGRRQGTAESDWLRAEALLRRPIAVAAP
jgi:hypothetical protein